MTLLRFGALLTAAIIAAACGGANADRGDAATAIGSTRNVAAAAPAALERALRGTVLAHHQLSVRILWTNKVPAKPTSVDGQALAALRVSARDRARRGIQVHLLHDRFR